MSLFPSHTRLTLGISTGLLILQPQSWGSGAVPPLCHLLKPRCILLLITTSILPSLWRQLLSPRLLHPSTAIPLPAEQKAWPRYFTSHQHKPNPDLSPGWLSRAVHEQSQPCSRVVGETPGVPLPLSGVAVPPLWPCIWLLWAAQEAGACDQLGRQQQQPLLFHMSVFLALLCISVQELKLRILAEVLSVVTALRAVVRHSLACLLPLSLFLIFPFFFF